MTIDEFNVLGRQVAKDALYQCCACESWCEKMLSGRPYVDLAQIKASASEHWSALGGDAWREAFEGHPKIGDMASLKKKYESTQGWSGAEQGGVAGAQQATLEKLSRLNDEYLKRFGFIFIVCATGKSAAEMLSILESRIDQSPDLELQVAAAEQMKITHLRLEKML